MFRKVQVFTFLLVLACTASAEVAVTWSGRYAGKRYAPRAYTRSNLCCNNPNCGMRKRILDLIRQRESRLAAPVVPATPIPVPEPIVNHAPAAPVATEQPLTSGQQAYTVQVPFTQTVPYTVQEPYKARECYTDFLGRRSCRTVTRYRTVTKYQTETRYRTETRFRPVPTPAPQPQPAELDSSIIEVEAEELVLNFQPTPMPAVKALLAELQPQPGELLVDLGCGDGRFVIEACKTYGCDGLGIELNAETAAKASVAAEGVKGLSIVEGDVLTEDWSKAKIVVMYLYEDLIAEVWPKIPPGTLVASVNHKLPGESRKVVKQDHEFYIAFKN